MRYTGVTSRGIIMPIFRQGDDLVSLIRDNLIAAAENEGFQLQDRDVIGVTEAVVARTQGNYATVQQIAEDVRRKLGGEDMGIIFPIMSRNRFAIMLRAISMACKKLYVQLSFPSDEVGNRLISDDEMDRKGINPYTDSFDERGFRAIFGNNTVHPFTGIDYVNYYKSLGSNIEIVFSNDPRYILHYTKNVINCDIHTRVRTKRILKENGAERVFSLDDIMTEPVDGSGYNEKFGLLGANICSRRGSSHRQALRGHDLRRRRLQGPGGRHLGAGRSGDLSRLHRWPARDPQRTENEVFCGQ